MKPKCTETTIRGTQCQMDAIVGTRCTIHSPQHIAWSEQRKQNRRSAQQEKRA